MIALCLIALLVSIVVGFTKKVNIGCLSCVFAFLIATGGMGMRPSELYGLIPVKTLFPIICIMMFFGFALENGTLDVLMRRIMFRFHRMKNYLPLLVFLLAILLSGSGLGAGGATAIMGPFALYLSSCCGLQLIVIIVAVSGGAAVGSNFSWSQGGLVMKGLLESSEYSSKASEILRTAQMDVFLIELIFLCVIWVIFHKGTEQSSYNGEVEAFQPVQKKTLWLLGLITGIMIIPNVLNLMIDSSVLKHYTPYLDAGFICLGGAVCAMLMKLAPPEEVIKRRIPWSVVLTIGGISVLVGVAKEAGVVESLVGMMEQNVSRSVVPLLLCSAAMLMSLFAGAMSVVTPTFFTLVPELIRITGYSPEILYAAVVIGACLGGIAPFSSGGSMLLAACEDSKERDRLVYIMTILPFASLFVALIYQAVRLL